MYKRTIFLSCIAVVLMLNFHSSAQENYTLTYTIKGFNRHKAYLLAIHGHKYEAVDSNMNVQNGQIIFNLKATLPTGMYRIAFADSLYTDVIFNKENIELANSINYLNSGLRVLSSEENRIFYNYWNVSKPVNDTISFIAQMGDKLYEASGHKMTHQLDSLQRKVWALNTRLNNYTDSLLRKADGMFAAKIIRAYSTPEYYAYIKKPGAYPYKTPRDFLRDHFFDNVDMQDSLLLNSVAIYAIITNYLNTFGDPASTDNYIRAIDTIMKKTAVSKAISEYALNLLLNTFETSTWENVFVHLVDTYVAANSCGISDAQAYKKKSDAIKKLVPGNASPAVVLNDVNGKRTSLYDINAKLTMIFFWNSDCPHCRQSMSELKELYETYHPKGLEVYAIAADTDAKAWKDAVLNYGTTWINVSDLKGGASDLIIQFHAWATPCFFLLDAQKKILSKPLTIFRIREELKKYLK